MAQLEGAGVLRNALLSALNVAAGTSGEPTAVGKQEVRRILVVELWNIGDVVLLLPFLTQLRKSFPRASVTLLARPHARVLLEGTGLVDEFLDDAAPAENWLSLNPLLGGWRDLWRLRRQLRSRHFDLAFQCRLHVREHVILAMSGARRRIGYAFGEGDRMLTDALEVGDPHRHKVDDWLRLLSVVDATPDDVFTKLAVSPDESAAAAEVLRLRGVSDGDVVIGIHPGASLPEKRWPTERFAEVAAELASRPGVQVVAFADPAGIGAELHDVPGVIGLSTSLRELMALIERCTLLICNDSGPMHIAGGLGVQTVAVFGSGVARWFAPLGDRHELVSAGSAQLAGGIDRVTTESVLQAVDRSLAITAARGK
ncbi:MAG TPA: glycosyltransferase family 9 protein [Gemmatimonadaceae bacterium]|nr:glycosyltransferase family 9 protein [Gemmatimonadaceae bacterium]